MSAVSKLFALCAIGTIIVVAMIGEAGDYSFQLIVVGTLVATVFGCLSAAAQKISLRRSQLPVDSLAEKIWLEVQQEKQPRFRLYLRPFNITNKVPVSNAKHRPDLFSLARYEQSSTTDFESVLEDASPVPFIALGRPGEAVGAGRIKSDDETWWDKFLLLAKSAEKIFVVPSYKTGTMREIEWLKASGNLKKCIFICPPGPPRIQLDRNSEWDKAANSVAISLASYSSLGKFFAVGDDGQLLREITLDGKNRSAVTRAISSLGQAEIREVVAPASKFDESLLPSLSRYKQPKPMNGLLKFVLIVLAAMLAGFVINIFTS